MKYALRVPLFKEGTVTKDTRTFVCHFESLALLYDRFFKDGQLVDSPQHPNGVEFSWVGDAPRFDPSATMQAPSAEFPWVIRKVSGTFSPSRAFDEGTDEMILKDVPMDKKEIKGWIIQGWSRMYEHPRYMVVAEKNAKEALKLAGYRAERDYFVDDIANVTAEIPFIAEKDQGYMEWILKEARDNFPWRMASYDEDLAVPEGYEAQAAFFEKKLKEAKYTFVSYTDFCTKYATPQPSTPPAIGTGSLVLSTGVAMTENLTLIGSSGSVYFQEPKIEFSDTSINSIVEKLGPAMTEFMKKQWGKAEEKPEEASAEMRAMLQRVQDATKMLQKMTQPQELPSIPQEASPSIPEKTSPSIPDEMLDGILDATIEQGSALVRSILVDEMIPQIDHASVRFALDQIAKSDIVLSGITLLGGYGLPWIENRIPAGKPRELAKWVGHTMRVRGFAVATKTMTKKLLGPLSSFFIEKAEDLEVPIRTLNDGKVILNPIQQQKSGVLRKE